MPGSRRRLPSNGGVSPCGGLPMTPAAGFLRESGGGCLLVTASCHPQFLQLSVPALRLRCPPTRTHRVRPYDSGHARQWSPGPRFPGVKVARGRARPHAGPGDGGAAGGHCCGDAWLCANEAKPRRCRPSSRHDTSLRSLRRSGHTTGMMQPIIAAKFGVLSRPALAGC